MNWEDVPACLDEWTVKAAAPAFDVRQAASEVYPDGHAGYYYHPELDQVACFGPTLTRDDQARVKAAAARGVGADQVREPFLNYQELQDPAGAWIKVAYSQSLRRIGELLNFFPGQYPGGMPNHPSPLTALLTSGLLGAGLGWGSGKVLSHVLPQGVGSNLPRTGMLLGGALGAAPGAVWGLSNHAIGRSFNDPSTLAQSPHEEPVTVGSFAHGSNTPVQPETAAPGSVASYVQQLTPPQFKRSEDLEGIVLGRAYTRALDEFTKLATETFGRAYMPPEPTGIDVNINELGQTLWEHGASSNLAATTMGAMYAAQQLPDSRSRPGWATAGQLGQLAANAAGDYTTGYLAGAALNAVIGTPFRASTYGLGNLALSVIGAVIPKLFGGDS